MNLRPLPDILKQKGPINERKKRIRVSALILKEGKVLMVKNVINRRVVWFLPGGSVDWGETLKQALVREIIEELDVEADIKNMVAVIDSISPQKDFHSIDIIFLTTFKGKLKADGECGDENEITDNIYGIDKQWIEISKIKENEVYPKKFLTKHLPKVFNNLDKTGIYLGNDWN